jgi:5-formyltetrahydrofolate cyclo-ligase
MTSTVTKVRSGSTTSRFTDGEVSQPPPSATKAEWRAWARTVEVDAAAVSPSVAAHLDAFLGRGVVVLTYLPMAGEVDPGPPARERTLLVTRTPPRGPLSVHGIDQPREMHPFGFEQPTDGAAEWEGRIDVALVPGAVFGRDGSRLGRGAGHYDRFFATHDVPVRVGVVPERLLVEAVPTEHHDVPMTHVVTESGVLAV